MAGEYRRAVLKAEANKEQREEFLEWLKKPEDTDCRRKLEEAIQKTTLLKEEEPAIFHAKGLTSDQRFHLLRAMDNADIIAKSEQSYVQMSYMCGCKVWETNEEGVKVERICARTMISSIWGQKYYDYVNFIGKCEFKCWADYKMMYCLAAAGDVLCKISWI